MSETPLTDYLKAIAKKLTLTPSERQKIDVSVNAITEKLKKYFADDGIVGVKTFGSYDRDTLLSRKTDEESDVDILILFSEEKWVTQTYLNKLKRFAEDNYKSEVFQDYPTIVIELDHIRFELTPCIYRPDSFWYYEKYSIPERDGDAVKWVETHPDKVKKSINEYSKTKPVLLELIHLYKYWNIVHRAGYKTFEVEKFVIESFSYSKDLYDNFFRTIYSLHYKNGNQSQNDLNKRMKLYKENIEVLVDRNMKDYALMELKKIIPELS